MHEHDWHGRVLVLLVCFAVAAALAMGCTNRRSEGQKPVVVEDDEDTRGFAKPVTARSTDEDAAAQGGLKQQFRGGIEPDDYKAQKLVNQLFNYCVGLCSIEQECPKDLDAAREGIRKQYSIFWPKDPWGNFYQYKRLDPQTCEVWSSGPDGKDGTPDDIHVSKSNRQDAPNT